MYTLHNVHLHTVCPKRSDPIYSNKMGTTSWTYSIYKSVCIFFRLYSLYENAHVFLNI